MAEQSLVTLLAPRRNRLGILVKKKGSPTLFSEAGARLRELADAKETPEVRTEIEAALACPWWSLRVLAILAIGQWGGQRNKRWLMERACRPLHPLDPVARDHSKARMWTMSEICASRRAVAPQLNVDDFPALLRLWFLDGQADGGWRPIYGSIPADMLATAAAEQLRHGDSVRREAATRLLATRLDDPGCRASVSALAADRDGRVREAAALRLRWHEQALERRTRQKAR